MIQDVIQRPSTPQELIEALHADRAAFVALAQRVLKCRARAEDVVQEAALRIWQSGRVTVLRSPAGYLRRMVRNLAIDAVRQISVECRLMAPAAAASELAGPCTCPQERIEACEALRAVTAGLQAAPTRMRRAIVAHRIDGVPQKVIAAELGVSPTLVNFMIRDATLLCRKALEDTERECLPAVAA